MRKRILSLCISLCGILISSQAQKTNDTDHTKSLFREAKKMYEIKSYDASLDKLTELKSKLGINTISSPISYDGRLTNKYIDLLEEADYKIGRAHV